MSEIPDRKTSVITVGQAGASETLGVFLRERRQKQGWTLGQMALKSGLSKSTLSKWENGSAMPRLPDLLIVLALLAVTESERTALLQQAGYAVPATSTRSHQPFGENAAGFDNRLTQTIPKSFPIHGDLLRVMRHRAQFPQAEVARRANVSQGTLAKWEKGVDWPSAERLHKLAFALGATVDEIAVLSTGIPTLFSNQREITSEEDLLSVKEEIDALRTRSHFYPFAAHDLWFLSLLSRLDSPARRTDGLGEQAFHLWFFATYLYLTRLYTAYRYDDMDYVIPHFLERVRPKLAQEKWNHLWGFYTWAVLQHALNPLEKNLHAPRHFLRRQNPSITVPITTIRLVRELTATLHFHSQSDVVRKSPESKMQHAVASAFKDMAITFLTAVDGDVNESRRFESQSLTYDDLFERSNGLSADVSIDRAQNAYFRGDVGQALDSLPELPPAPESDSDILHIDQVQRLKQLRFQCRILLGSSKTFEVDEGHHLLEVFNREVVLLPQSLIRTYLGPIQLTGIE